MLYRTLTALSVIAALVFPGSAAQAGFIKNAAKVAILGAKVDAVIAKQAIKQTAKTAKLGLQVDAAVAKCLVKAATTKPCI